MGRCKAKEGVRNNGEHRSNRRNLLHHGFRRNPRKRGNAVDRLEKEGRDYRRPLPPG